MEDRKLKEYLTFCTKELQMSQICLNFNRVQQQKKSYSYIGCILCLEVWATFLQRPLADYAGHINHTSTGPQQGEQSMTHPQCSPKVGAHGDFSLFPKRLSGIL